MDPEGQSIYTFQTAWEEDLEERFTDEDWANLRLTICFTTRSINIQLTSCKIMYRWHLTPYRLHKIYPHLSDLCWKRCGLRGTYLHCLWQCPCLQVYWSQVISCTEAIAELHLPRSPTLILLHNWKGLKVKPEIRNFIDLLFCAAVSLITLHWKSTRVPTVQDWLLKLTDFYIQDIL